MFKKLGKILPFILFSLLFVSEAFAEFSSQRIAVGVLTRGELRLENVKVGVFKYTMDFFGSNYDLINLESFVSKKNDPVVGYSQVFRFGERAIAESFKNPPSAEGNLFMVTAEDGPGNSDGSYNLAFLEISSDKKIRVSYHFGAKAGYVSKGKFTAQNYDKKDPKAAKLVVTTKWHNVE